MKVSSSNIKMIIYDWYDGPVGGVVTLADARSFCFFLLDWDSEHRIRIFSMQPISNAFDGMVKQLTVEAPKWPVWFPAELVHPSDRSREWTSSVKALRGNPENTESVLVWDTIDERAIEIRQLPPEARSGAIPWFDAVESAEGPFDWFRFLSIPRK
jgi:hypothetical protein